MRASLSMRHPEGSGCTADERDRAARRSASLGDARAPRRAAVARRASACTAGVLRRAGQLSAPCEPPGTGAPGAAAQPLGRELGADEAERAGAPAPRRRRSVLVGQDRQTADDLAPARPPQAGLGERPGAVGVVGGVEDQGRVAGDDLHPARQLEAAKRRLADPIGVQAAERDLRRGCGDGEVAAR